MNTYQKKSKAKGFTLIEIGVVLAIIGVLAAIAIPSVSYFLRQGRVKSVVGSVNSIKNWIGSLQSGGAVGGSLPITEGARPPSSGAALVAQDAAEVAAAARLDHVLLSAGITEKLVSFGMGNQATSAEGEGADLMWSSSKRAFFMSDGVGGISSTAKAGKDWSACSRVESRLSAPTAVPSESAGANFRLDGVTNLPVNAVVAYVLLKDVPYKDAVELAKAFSGDGLLASSDSAQDAGPVVFQKPASGSSTTDVFVYLAAL